MSASDMWLVGLTCDVRCWYVTGRPYMWCPLLICDWSALHIMYRWCDVRCWSVTGRPYMWCPLLICDWSALHVMSTADLWLVSLTCDVHCWSVTGWPYMWCPLLICDWSALHVMSVADLWLVGLTCDVRGWSVTGRPYTWCPLLICDWSALNVMSAADLWLVGFTCDVRCWSVTGRPYVWCPLLICDWSALHVMSTADLWLVGFTHNTFVCFLAVTGCWFQYMLTPMATALYMLCQELLWAESCFGIPCAPIWRGIFMRTKTHTRYTEMWTVQCTVCYRLVLLCTSSDILTYSLVIQHTSVLGLVFKFSIVRNSWKWRLLYVHVERVCVAVKQVQSRKRRN